jgi:uncharacterized protein YndB with AHSA1/START domain
VTSNEPTGTCGLRRRRATDRTSLLLAVDLMQLPMIFRRRDRPTIESTTRHGQENEGEAMKITVETTVRAPLEDVWSAWNSPADIRKWNSASDDWHTTQSSVDLRDGGTFRARMEAKDGSQGFDFEGTYTRVVPRQLIEYRMSDGREVQVHFAERSGGVVVRETFDAENENAAELQRSGWQAILDNFRRHVESRVA